MSEPKPVIFNTQEVAKVDDKVIADLKRRAMARADKRFRLCLHRGADERVQEMILVHGRGAYVRPHRHAEQTKSILMIEGDMLIVLFDDAGNRVDRFTLGPPAAGGKFMVRLEKSLWHTELPLTDPVVFLETLEGPFRPLTSDSFAPWSPSPDDQAGIEKFMKSILSPR